MSSEKDKNKSLKGSRPVWTLKTIKLSDLKEYHKNPRSLTEKQKNDLKKSLNNFGCIDKPIVNQDLVLIGGHQRVHVLTDLAVEEIECWFPDRLLTDKEVEELNIRLNKNTGEWDFDILANEWDFSELCQWGFSFEDLGMGDDLQEDADTETESTLSPSNEPITKAGDLYELGEHRLLCGDCTIKENVDIVLNGNSPVLMVTDPPYGVEYEPEWRTDKDSTFAPKERSKKAAKASGKVKNDDIFDWKEAFKLFSGDIAYVWCASIYSPDVARSIDECGFERKSLIIWNKQNFVISRGDYHWKHETCWYAVRKGKTHNWQGSRDQSSVWDIDNLAAFGKSADDERTAHSTQKPLQCMSKPIQNNTCEGEGVYDPFCGSGTTLIACEKLKRICYAIELDPAYCDIIVKRWMDHTGLIPKKNGVEIIESDYAKS
jgi:DNA modification methylase